MLLRNQMPSWLAYSESNIWQPADSDHTADGDPANHLIDSL